MHVETIGSGPRIVLVHGSITNSATWRPVRPLAERYTLVIPDRPGYPPNPPLDAIDFETQAGEIANLLEPRAHVLGFSHGGVISLLAAARRPGLVRSLAVIEPPCFAVALDHPAVAATVAEFAAVWNAGIDDPQEFVARFAAVFGDDGGVPGAVPAGREQGVRALMVERPPWEAAIPLAALRRAPFPKLVLSSGGHAAYEAVCDVLARELAGERAVVPGAGHGLHQAPGFLGVYERFLAAA